MHEAKLKEIGFDEKSLKTKALRQLRERQKVLRKIRSHQRQDITLSENEGFKYIKESFEDLKIVMVTVSFRNFYTILQRFEIAEVIQVIIRLKQLILPIIYKRKCLYENYTNDVFVAFFLSTHEAVLAAIEI